MKVQQNGKRRERKNKRIGFLETRQLNEAMECGTDGEWLQTQGNYFQAGRMEGARAPSLTGCSLLMDRGMGTHTHRHMQACTLISADTHTYADIHAFSTIKSASQNAMSGMLIKCCRHEKYEEYAILFLH